MTRSRVAAAAMALAAVAGVAVAMRGAPERPVEGTAGISPDTLPRAVEVEVLNGTATSGIATEAMKLLRQGGLDVVNLGNADSSLRGRTDNLIVVRRRDTTGVGRIIEVLGGATVIDQYDASRMVDLSVVLGRYFVSKHRR